MENLDELMSSLASELSEETDDSETDWEDVANKIIDKAVDFTKKALVPIYAQIKNEIKKMIYVKKLSPSDLKKLNSAIRSSIDRTAEAVGEESAYEHIDTPEIIVCLKVLSKK